MDPGQSGVLGNPQQNLCKVVPFLLSLWVEHLDERFKTLDREHGQPIISANDASSQTLQSVEVTHSSCPTNIVLDKLFSDHQLCCIPSLAVVHKCCIGPIEDRADSIGRKNGMLLLVVTFEKNKEHFEESIVAVVTELIGKSMEHVR